MLINANVGYDTRFQTAYGVTVKTLLENAPTGFEITPLLLQDLVAKGIYERPTIKNEQGLFDQISDAPMATEFAISRFFIPYLNKFKGWTIFCDSDFLFRKSIYGLIKSLDPKYAVYCVKHNYNPTETVKMDGQAQTIYSRKNWSSFMIFNNEHPSNKVLRPDLINQIPGRDLHGFFWLKDEEIGELGQEWNWLEGHSDLSIDPSAVHFTRGTPDVEGYENVPYADEWRFVAKDVAVLWSND